MMNLKHILYSLLLVSSTASLAQQAAPAPAAPASSASAPSFYVPYGNLENMSAEEKARAQALGNSVAQQLLDAYQNRREPEMEQLGQQLRKRADDIADAALASNRKKVLEFLGIDPEGDSTLYYFVSWNMPLEMLRSYAIEAMWAGGTLVFKGVPPGKDFVKFVTEDLKSLVYGKGAAANISLDPRLFDAYEIKSVPSIVFTTERATMQCQGVLPVPVKAGDIEASYDTCPPLDPNKYHKISGAVTSSYALDLFIENGMTKAVPFRKALARGFATGTNGPGKTQIPFKGSWEDAFTPAKVMQEPTSSTK